MGAAGTSTEARVYDHKRARPDDGLAPGSGKLQPARTVVRRTPKGARGFAAELRGNRELESSGGPHRLPGSAMHLFARAGSGGHPHRLRRGDRRSARRRRVPATGRRRRQPTREERLEPAGNPRGKRPTLLHVRHGTRSGRGERRRSRRGYLPLRVRVDGSQLEWAVRHGQSNGRSVSRGKLHALHQRRGQLSGRRLLGQGVPSCPAHALTTRSRLRRRPAEEFRPSARASPPPRDRASRSSAHRAGRRASPAARSPSSPIAEPRAGRSSTTPHRSLPRGWVPRTASLHLTASLACPAAPYGCESHSAEKGQAGTVWRCSVEQGQIPRGASLRTSERRRSNPIL